MAELLARGWTPDLTGRPAELDGALAGAAAVVNCAGPFAAAAAP